MLMIVLIFQIMSLNDENYTLGSEYLVDILFWVKQHERRPSLRYKKLSPQIEKRGQLIEWSKDVSQKLGLSDSTFHLAVRLIDLFMDGHDIMVCIHNAMRIILDSNYDCY